MAQYVPNSIGLQVADVGEAYDRAVLFPVNVAAIIVTSIDVWVGPGDSVRAALISSDVSNSTTGAVVVQDLGLFTNSGGAAAWINKTTTGTPIVATAKYPGVVVRQDSAPHGVATTGEGYGYPHGDAVYASRADNGYAGIANPFPSPVNTDEGIDASNRIPYVRLNYVLSGNIGSASGSCTVSGVGAALTSGITSVDTDNVITEDQTNFHVVGTLFTTTGTLTATIDGVTVTLPVGTQTNTDWTVTRYTRNNLKYGNQTWAVNPSSGGSATKTVTVNPAAGFSVGSVNPGTANTTVGQSILAGISPVNAGSQLRVPSSIPGASGTITFTWETASGDYTGRLSNVTGMTETVVGFNFDFYDNSAKTWTTLTAVLDKSGTITGATVSKSDVFENDLLKLIFNNTTIAGIGDATGIVGSTAAGSLYLSLHTADPGEAGNQATSETAYTSYARVAVARTSGGWTVTNNSVSPAANIDFPQCTGGTATITHFGVGSAASGNGKLMYSGTVTPNIAVSNGVTPRLTTSTAITED